MATDSNPNYASTTGIENGMIQEHKNTTEDDDLAAGKSFISTPTLPAGRKREVFCSVQNLNMLTFYLLFDQF